MKKLILIVLALIIPSILFSVPVEIGTIDGKIVIDETARTLKFDEPKNTSFEIYSLVGAHKHKIYQLPNGRIKWDINFVSQPLDNDIAFRIKNYQDYDFFYQPLLTAKELEDGCTRQFGVDGSYQVYWKDKTKRNNEWKTGKLNDIRGGYAIATNGDRVWCTLWYDDKEGILWVTIPQKFYDTHTVAKLDPEYGSTSCGASELNIGAQRTHAFNISGTMLENGTITALHCWIRWYQSETNAIAVNYYGNDGAKSTASDTIGNFGFPNAQTQFDYSISGDAESSGDKLAFGFLEKIGTTPYFAYDTVTTTEAWNNNWEGDTTVNATKPSINPAMRQFSVWATYTASGGGSPASAIFSPQVIIFEN